MNISLYEPPIDFAPDTTGFKLRKCREELGLSGEQLSKLSGISKSQILKAERSEFYLNREHYIKVCTALHIDPESIIDDEYKFFYEGYERAIEFLISKMGIQAIMDFLRIHRTTLLNWSSGRWLPQFEQRRALIKLYNELLK